MWRCSLLALLALARPAAADTVGPFVSPGISISFGTRGLTFGVEVSAGYLETQSGFWGGLVGGLDFSPWAPAHLPRTRAYLEGELGWAAFGIGIGPSLVFWDQGIEIGMQLTPFVAYSSLVDCGEEPFQVTGLFYRYTSLSQTSLREGGGFLKRQWYTDDETPRFCD